MDMKPKNIGLRGMNVLRDGKSIGTIRSIVGRPTTPGRLQAGGLPRKPR